MSQLIAQNAFRVVEGRPVTSSRIVAEYFSKKHSDVVRAIQTILAQKPELEASRNFAQWSEEVEIGSGAKRTVICYWMDRKGFSILAMGFTGAKALDFKCAFYDEFERMEKQLHPAIECPVAAEISVARLTVEHQYAIQSAVGKRVHTSGASYQAVYQALKNRFKVPKYTYILERDFEEAIRFIETCDLRVPQSEPITERKAQVLASAEFCEHVRTLVYCWRYLFKKEIDLVYQTMRAMGSPHAPMLWEAIHDLNFVFLEKDLEKVGFPVKALECYKHWASRNNDE